MHFEAFASRHGGSRASQVQCYLQKAFWGPRGGVASCSGDSLREFSSKLLWDPDLQVWVEIRHSLILLITSLGSQQRFCLR